MRITTLHRVPYRLSALTVAVLALAGCASSGGGGGSSSSTPTPTPTPTPTLPANATANGVSVSATGTFTRAQGQDPRNVAFTAGVTDTGATLSTTGTVGRGTAGNVSSVTLNSTNAVLDGNTLTLTHGSNGATISNWDWGFQARSQDGNREAEGRTAMGKMDGSYAPGQQQVTYAYMSFGTWNDIQGTGGDNYRMATGDYVFGSATAPANIPTSGTATYTGAISGVYSPASGVMPYSTYADMSATADFSGRSLSFATTNSRIYDTRNETYDQATNQVVVRTDAVAADHLNMSGTLTYTAGSNLFSGNVADGGGRSGTATGRFYGPAAEEIGGVFSVSGSGAGGHFGHFAGKR